MAVKNKSTKKDLNNENITLYFREHNIPNDECNDGNFEDDDTDWIYKWGMKYNNITANKATYVSDDYRWFSIFTLGLADFGIGDILLNKNGQADNCGTYEPITFYPSTGPLLSTVTPVPVKRPRNRLYPALLDFEEVGYTSIIGGLKNLKSKKKIDLFSKVFKPTLLQYAQFRGPILARQDKYALDINDLKIYNMETGQEDRTGNSLDEEIFIPIKEWMYSASMHHQGHVPEIWNVIYEMMCALFGKDSEAAKACLKVIERMRNEYPDIPSDRRISKLRRWASWKYFASHTKTEYYTENKTKRDNYIKSLIKDNEELISFEEIIYGETPTEDYIRYILQACIGEEFYDYNDDLTFTVNDVTYYIDFEQEKFFDKSTNEIVRYINHKTGSVLSMDNYSYKEVLDQIIEEKHLDLVQEIKDIIIQEKTYNHKISKTTFDNLSYKQYFIKDEVKRQNKIDEVIKDKEYMYNTVPLTLRIGTDLSDALPLDNSNDFKETIYLLEKEHKSNDYNKDFIDKITIEPIVIFDGVTNWSTVSVIENKITYQKIYPDFSDMLNYNQLLKETNEETGETKIYTYENRTTKRPIAKTTPNSWLKIDKDGNVTTVDKVEQYSKEPKRTILVNKQIEDTVKFTLPNVTVDNDMRVLKYIYHFKRNLINGWFIKYKDKNDGKIKIRIHSEDTVSFNRNTCNVHPSSFDVLPLVPFYSVLDVTVPILVESRGLDMHFGALASSSAFRYFYFTYNKKVNQYYKNIFNWNLLRWDRHINGYYNDTEYKIKTPKKISKLQTNEKLLLYSPSLLKNPEMDDAARSQAKSSLTDYSTYYSKAPYGAYGVHTSVRFTFAIFFNRLVRRTKLLNKMAVSFLEFYYKQYSGEYGIPVSTYVYPNDRIQFTEKRLKLYFIKTQIPEEEVSSLKASYYSTLDYYNGFLTFYNRNKREKYVLHLNKLYPNWKATFFDNQSTNLFKQKYNEYTITLSDIIPLTYIDTISAVGDNVPITKYAAVKKKNNYYTYTVKSYYYNTPTAVTYKTKNNATKTRTIDMWGTNNVDEYICFYTPQNLDTFNINEDVIAETFNNFEERNIARTLFNFFDALTEEELIIYYKKIFGDNADLPVNVFEEDKNIFNYKDMFTDENSIVKVSSSTKVDFSTWTEDSVDVINYSINNLQPWADFSEDKRGDDYLYKMPMKVALFYDKNGDRASWYSLPIQFRQDSFNDKGNSFEDIKQWFQKRIPIIYDSSYYHNPYDMDHWKFSLSRDSYYGEVYTEYGGYGSYISFNCLAGYVNGTITCDSIDTKEWFNTFCPPLDNSPNVWTGDLIQDGWALWSYRQYLTNNLPMVQSRDLFLNYNYDNVYNGNKKVRESYIYKMVDELLYSAFPPSKIIKVEDFARYFIDIEDDNILLNIFTKEEIYELGFNNFLVTNDIDDPNDKTIVLAKVFTKLQNSLISDGGNGANINNFWMAIPVKAYNSFPFYAKIFCTRWFFVCDTYLARHYPEFNKTVYNKNQAYTIGIGVVRTIVLIIVSIVLMYFFPPAGIAAIAATVLSIAAMIFTVITLILQILAAVYIGTEFGKMCRKLAKVTAIISVVFGVAAAIVGGVAAISGASSAASSISTLTTTLQIINLCVTVINVVLTIVNMALKVHYQKQLNKQTERVNDKIDEYNQSIDAVYDFLEENEDKMNLDIVNPSMMITQQDHNIDTSIDQFYDVYTNDSLEYLYSYVEDYYYDQQSLGV